MLPNIIKYNEQKRGYNMKRERLEDYVLTIPDFPEKGIMFRDITSLNIIDRKSVV